MELASNVWINFVEEMASTKTQNCQWWPSDVLEQLLQEMFFGQQVLMKWKVLRNSMLDVFPNCRNIYYKPAMADQQPTRQTISPFSSFVQDTPGIEYMLEMEQLLASPSGTLAFVMLAILAAIKTQIVTLQNRIYKNSCPLTHKPNGDTKDRYRTQIHCSINLSKRTACLSMTIHTMHWCSIEKPYYLRWSPLEDPDVQTHCTDKQT